MPPLSDLGSLLQVFPDFDFQSPVISLQASHPLQVGGQAVIQALQSPHSGYTLCPPNPRPPSQPGPWTPSHPVQWWSGTLRSGSQSPRRLHRRWLRCWPAGPGSWVTARSPGSGSLWRSWSGC
uniref:Uncharacterized protein n=1 Tax=Molossus molossus TaxID=27622 RepID=A0A7J8EF19_MOLMO|nr:hypothetical protein HJG59_008916 [Molossus molossus]